tara:strand:+ start:471 stop:794 length:324 start_codon:yes stop_codon:yes gene_type:complete
MDRVIAQEILNGYGNPSVKVGDTNLVFARQTAESLDDIEAKTDEELIDEWKGLVWINEIYGQVSLNDMQRINLIELEMDDRKIESEPLKSWYEDESAKFDEQDFSDC